LVCRIPLCAVSPIKTAKRFTAQLRDVNEAIRGHEIEKVGQKLRGYMTDMKRIAVAG
jgi:hypothetical protein